MAVTAASNAVGVKPDLVAVRDAARAAGATLVVDGVHAAPHDPTDLTALGPDIYLCSAYKFYGPHVGVAFVRRSLVEQLAAFKVLAAPDTGPEKFETGSQNHEGIAALSGTIAGLGRLVGPGTGLSAREALRALGKEEGRLATALVNEIRGIPGVRVVGHHGKATDFVATVAFAVDGAAPASVASGLRRRGVFVTAGDFYATALAGRLGVGGTGWVRVGLAGYTSDEDVEHLVAALWAVAEEATRH